MKHRRVSNKRVKQLLEEIGVRDPLSDAMNEPHGTLREGRKSQPRDDDRHFSVETDRK
ncbi:hypothetical protein KCN56_02585 [Photobacterium galatheae]|uniref:hypothetical protein n=1 Tax=Photobacterium galatheae TaxID=1654360 RepID=UPI00202CE119|nr:hypothetical protein [Photobacterium galatheae]MCM0147456.1 hypothetical protein [Photobacterium galatheae]